MQCPNCGGTAIDRERILGMDTGDKKCCDCGYVGMLREFYSDEQPQKSIQLKPQQQGKKLT